MVCEHSINNPDRFHQCYMCITEAAARGANETRSQLRIRRQKTITQLQKRREELDMVIEELQNAVNDEDNPSSAPDIVVGDASRS